MDVTIKHETLTQEIVVCFPFPKNVLNHDHG